MNSDFVFDEKAPHEKGFAKHFEQHIKPKLVQIEHSRLDVLAEFRNRVLLAMQWGVTVLVVSVLILPHPRIVARA